MDAARRLLKEQDAKNVANSNKQYTDSFGRPSLTMVLNRTGAKKTQECVCCCETKQLDEFPTTAPTKACEHDAKTCSECLTKWNSASLQNQYWTVLLCPDCPEKLVGEDLVNANMLGDDSGRYNYLHARIRNGRNPGYRYCMQPACKSGQISRDPNTLNCQICNGYDCVRCNAPFHYHCASHEAYQGTIVDRKAESDLSEAFIAGEKEKGVIVACPNCECLIESFGRVSVARCTRCTSSFDWEKTFGAWKEEMGGVVGDGGEEKGEKKGGARGRHVAFSLE
jgi:hypothetical protein